MDQRARRQTLNDEEVTGDSTNIAGKVVVITGTSSGLGEATARHLSDRGAIVVLGARRVDRLQALVDSPLERRKINDWARTIDVNIKGVLHGIAAALPHMQRQKSGHFINVSSVAGHRVGPGSAVYAATKTAVRVISEGLRQEVKPWNLRTTIISPGAVATELPNSITEADVAKGIGQFYEQYAIPADSFARAVGFAISQPDDASTSTRFSFVRHARSCDPEPVAPVQEARMKLFAALLTALALFTPASMEAQTMVISRAGSRAVRAPPPDNFTGSVRVEMLFEPLDPSHASGGYVTFEPRARTAWHSHPRGQILIVTSGIGRVQLWGAPIEEIRVGDVVTIPAGQKHWHGASPQSAMTHLAVSGHRDGTAVQWMEKVSDDQYDAAVSPQQGDARPSGPRQQALAPGLAVLTDDVLYGDVWRRPELSPRNRSLVTISVLIATGKTAQLAGHLGRGLDNGLQPGEASGLLAHLAIYSGWPSAVSALDVYEQVYTARNVDTAALRTMGPRLAAPASDASRAKAATEQWGAVAPKFVELTNAVVFDDLWRRSDLTPRDRSLVTLAALAAIGDDDQLELYVRRGLESGLTRTQIVEAMTHLGFYAGWGKATAAMTAVTRLLGK